MIKVRKNKLHSSIELIPFYDFSFYTSLSNKVVPGLLNHSVCNYTILYYIYTMMQDTKFLSIWSSLLLVTNRTVISILQQTTAPHSMTFLLSTLKPPPALPSLSPPPPLDVVSMLHVSCSGVWAMGGAGALRPFFLRAMEPPGEEAMESWGEEGGGGAIFFLRGVVLVEDVEVVLEMVDGLLLGKTEMVNPVIVGGSRSRGVVRVHELVFH